MDKATVPTLEEVHLLRIPQRAGKQSAIAALQRDQWGIFIMRPSQALSNPDIIGVYRQGGTMRCPDCGQSQWLVGRMVAECACCEAALPLDLGYRTWLDMAKAPPRSQSLRA